jgi:hypothetical protein
MKVKYWIICAQDRGKWKEIVERAKLSVVKGSSAPEEEDSFFEIFRTSKCSSSRRLVHAVLWYFFHTSILVSSTSCHRPDCLYECMKEIP